VHERAIRLYDAGIRETDDAIGKLLDGLERRGWLDNTVVVLTSDHGEAFREHGTTEHGWNLYPEVYEVPLVLVWPGRIPGGKRIREQVRSIDIAPTLMELAGLPVPASFDGQSLLPLDAGERRDLTALCAVGLNDYIPRLDYVAVVSPDHLYIRERKSDVVEFYALQSDPGAQNDLGASHPMAASYAALEGPGPGAATEQTTLDERTKERLRSLGYLDGE
jgi:arylsulfatase A-like enzyme